MSVGEVGRMARNTPAAGPALLFAAAVGVAASLAFGGLLSAHRDAALPLAVALLFAFASAAALLGWRQRRMREPRLTYWDVAGALVFVGIAASTAVEPDQLVRLVNDGRSP